MSPRPRLDDGPRRLRLVGPDEGQVPEQRLRAQLVLRQARRRRRLLALQLLRG